MWNSKQLNDIMIVLLARQALSGWEDTEKGLHTHGKL